MTGRSYKEVIINGLIPVDNIIVNIFYEVVKVLLLVCRGEIDNNDMVKYEPQYLTFLFMVWILCYGDFLGLV